MRRLLARVLLSAHMTFCRRCKYGLSIKDEEAFMQWVDSISHD